MDKARFQAIYERVKQKHEAERLVKEYVRRRNNRTLPQYVQVEAKSDAQVLYAIKLGVNTVAEIITATKFSQTTVRLALMRLILRGLVLQVSSTKPADRKERRGRRRFTFQAVENPDGPSPEIPAEVPDLPPIPEKYR